MSNSIVLRKKDKWKEYFQRQKLIQIKKRLSKEVKHINELYLNKFVVLIQELNTYKLEQLQYIQFLNGQQPQLMSDISSKKKKKNASIKELYKSAAKNCHPDIVKTKESEEIFKILKKAYEEDNFKIVEKINDTLQSHGTSGIELYFYENENNILIEEIKLLQNDYVFKKYMSYCNNLDLFFTSEEKILNEELRRYRDARNTFQL